MKKILTALAVVAMLSVGAANAGIHQCPDGSWRSNCGNTTTPPTPPGNTGGSNTNTNTNTAGGGNGYGLGVGLGGKGGQGGKGGAAYSGSAAGAAALSGSQSGVRNSGNSTNDLSNRNSQGQQQGQVGIVRGGNTRVNTGDVDASSRNRLSNDSTSSARLNGNNSSVGDVVVNLPGELNRDLSTTILDSRDLSTSIDDADVSLDASDQSSTVIYGDEAQKRNPVASAWAAPLVTSNDTCMGSTSAGGQGITLGLSFATTWTDDDCIIRKDARFLHNAQHANVALGLMCEKDAVRRAVARAGSVEERLNCGLNEDGSEPAPVVKATDASDYDIE